MKNGLYITSAFDQAKLPYSYLEGLDSSIFSERFIKQCLTLFMLTASLAVLFSYLIYSLLASLMTQLLTLRQNHSFSFGQLWKIIVASSLWPATLFFIAQSLHFTSFILLFILRLAPFLLANFSIFQSDHTKKLY